MALLRTVRVRTVLAWTGLAAAALLPPALAAASPLLAWRSPVYVMAGFAGVLALVLLLFQPLLAGRLLPGLAPRTARRLHRRLGGLTAALVATHVIGLWITSPPDVIDALLFAAPTPFSAWGVIAMWAVLATVAVAALRRRLGLSPRDWRRLHAVFAVPIVAGTVLHALLIEGTMEPISKAVLCLLLLLASAKLALDSWRPALRRRAGTGGGPR
ncbi:ferric reductase-like transmembrane domain-containing protein [Mangrovicoccus sp. HB161399]|uniref:ferric reductase-like transmembrane domain-containing protein n=1 Tax=Mangrovicoccus sp. HB161399 TaxID=2720392 RepID=UPI0015564812|nr:ferric reductase-like transmembrane domain-containing protein [Mangrovicoccus sp. HB161399]